MLDAEEEHLARVRLTRAHGVDLPPRALLLVEQRSSGIVLHEALDVRVAVYLMEEQVALQVKGGADGLPPAAHGSAAQYVKREHLIAHEGFEIRLAWQLLKVNGR